MIRVRTVGASDTALRKHAERPERSRLSPFCLCHAQAVVPAHDPVRLSFLLCDRLRRLSLCLRVRLSAVGRRPAAIHTSLLTAKENPPL